MPTAAKVKFGQIGSGSVVRRLARTRKKKRRRVGYCLAPPILNLTAMISR